MFTRLVSVAVLLTSNAMASDFQSLTVEKVAGNFQFTEGPVWVASKGELLFSDIPANRIVRWSNGKAETFRAPSGNSNGLTLDKQGRLLACEHGNRRVSRTEPDGTVVTLADRYDGKRLNSPNDIVCKSDGAIYFTDPPYGVTPNQRELDFQGVYRISPDGKTLTLLVKDFLRPNGIALSPDEKTLLCSRHSARPRSRLRSVPPTVPSPTATCLCVQVHVPNGGVEVRYRQQHLCRRPGAAWKFLIRLGNRLASSESAATRCWAFGDAGGRPSTLPVKRACTAFASPSPVSALVTSSLKSGGHRSSAPPPFSPLSPASGERKSPLPSLAKGEGQGEAL